MEVYDKLKGTIKKVLNEDIGFEIDQNTNLNELGFDSLKLTILTKYIMDLYQVNVSRAEINRVQTMKGISELIYSKTV